MEVTKLVCAWVCLITLGSAVKSFAQKAPYPSPQMAYTLNEKLNTPITHFDNEGRPFIEGIIAVAYKFRIPMGVEYVDSEALTKRLTLKARNTFPREVLAKLVSLAPGYDIAFHPGIVQVYSAGARRDPKNPLNFTFDHYEIKGEDSQEASFNLFAAVWRRLGPNRLVGGSVPVGTAGPASIILSLRNAKAYEILDAIIAQNGSAIWTVTVRPEDLASAKGKLWSIYSLDPEWESIVLQDLRALFPAKQQAGPGS